MPLDVRAVCCSCWSRCSDDDKRGALSIQRAMRADIGVS